MAKMKPVSGKSMGCGMPANSVMKKGMKKMGTGKTPKIHVMNKMK